MNEFIHTIPWREEDRHQPEALLLREWLITNGLGGYASGTISGAVTRRYHGWLVAALPAPHGRTMMFNHLSERVRLPGGDIAWLGAEERADGALTLPGALFLKEFRLEAGLPVWRFEIGAYVIEKRALMQHRQNTVHVTYCLLQGDGIVRLSLRPSVSFRRHDGRVDEPLHEPYAVTSVDDQLELAGGPQFPPLRLLPYGRRMSFTLRGRRLRNIHYRIEATRGYESTGELWSPGYYSMDLAQGIDATLVASTEPWEIIRALRPEEAVAAEVERRSRLVAAAVPEARTGIGAELVLAADQFIVAPAVRAEDAARAGAAGEEVCTIVAGYHWFTDWGRDTMISLEGLTLVTGRHAEAGWILGTFLHHVRDGLIPNLFPEAQKEGLYHTADATLWLFHAIDRYLTITKNKAALETMLPKLAEIISWHNRGTHFGIGVDPVDGLLRQGAQGYQLTWMDAKCRDWVVTPRRGKAVEINGLWYNALRLMEQWTRELRGEEVSRPYGNQAARVYDSFNRRFWYAKGGYLYDVIDGEDGDDAACRPNQLLAMSPRYSVLDPAHWRSVIDVVVEQLLTPVGLRSLSPRHPDYKPTYHGDLQTRDAAYHQGTVWAWLIGPFIDAWVKLHPKQRLEARHFLAGFLPQLSEACIGSISEVFDAEPPYAPRGCVAQAWSIAEVLRCWCKVLSTECSPRGGQEDNENGLVAVRRLISGQQTSKGAAPSAFGAPSFVIC